MKRMKRAVTLNLGGRSNPPQCKYKNDRGQALAPETAAAGTLIEIKSKIEALFL